MQCRSPAEIPWSEITPDSEVQLFASRTVQSEIDRFKGDGKGRRSQRARKVSSWFSAVLDSCGPIVLRDALPKVTLDLPPRIAREHVFPSNLDTTSHDDRIVGEVLAYIGGAAILLTDDTNMKLTAREEGLPFIATPDSWRLEPEPDSRDKLMVDLQRRLAALERSAPVIEISLANREAQPPGIDEVHYDPLRMSVVDELVDAVKSICPIKIDFAPEDERPQASTGQGGFNRLRKIGRISSVPAV